MTENTIADQMMSEATGHYHAICAIRERSKVCDEEHLVDNYLLAIAICFFEEQAKSEMETIAKLMTALKEREPK